MANETKIANIVLRRGTTAAWAATNYVPADGEPCVEITTSGERKLKIGDGTSAWSALPYVSITDLADLTDDANHRTVTDTEKAAWNAKANASDLDAKANNADLATIAKSGKLADATEDTTHRVVTDAEKTKWNGKQDALTFDSAPTASSNNPVTSGGVKTALDKKANDADLATIAKSGKLADASEDATHRTVTDEEKAKWNNAAGVDVPKKTSDLTNDGDGESPFATEEYVNEKTTNIYTYKGSVATYAELPKSGQKVGDTYNVVAAYENYPAGTNFAWNGSEWDALGGSIDVSVFVKSSELSTIAKSGKLADASDDATHRLVTDTEKAAWNAKQAALTFDSAPTASSNNPVTSGGVKTALDKKANDADLATIAKSGKLADASEDTTHRTVTDTEKSTWNAKANASDLDKKANDADLATIAKSGKLADATEDTTHRVVTDAEKTKWNGKQDALTFDATPTANSTKPVTSGGVKAALDLKANASAVPKASTDLTDSASLMRYTDTITIDGGTV